MDQAHGPAERRIPRATTLVMSSFPMPEILGLTDVKGVVSAAEQVDVMAHGYLAKQG